MSTKTLSPELLHKIDAYWRAFLSHQVPLPDPVNHDNMHIRGYQEEGAITTPFDMTSLNDMDRFHLVMDTIDRLPQTGNKGIYLKQQLKDKLIEHKQYIARHGQDLPENRNWKWSNVK